MTSWPPTLPCGGWPPLRPRFCTTAQIRGFLSTPVARHGPALRVSWRAQAAQWTSSPALHSRLHGPSRKAILVRRTWRREFNFRRSGSATRRRQRGEGDKGVALMAYVEPQSSTASVCARDKPRARPQPCLCKRPRPKASLSRSPPAHQLRTPRHPPPIHHPTSTALTW